MRFKVEGASAAAGANVGAASTVQDSTEVLIVNTTANPHLVTIANSSDTTLGTFNLAGGDMVVLVKAASDQIFAANVGVTLSPVNTRV